MGIEFYTRPHTRGPKPKGEWRVCEVCHEEFWLRPSFARNGRYLRCSRPCYVKTGLHINAGRLGGVAPHITRGHRAKRRNKRRSIAIPAFWPYVSSDTSVVDESILAVHEALPLSLPPDVREDVAQDILVALLEGKFDMGEILDKMPFFIKAHFRLFPKQFGPLSLDAAPPWDPYGQPLKERL